MGRSSGGGLGWRDFPTRPVTPQEALPVTDTLERVKTYQQFIGGSFVDAADGRTAEVINPANDQVIANVPASSHEDVDRAVERRREGVRELEADHAAGPLAAAAQARRRCSRRRARSSVGSRARTPGSRSVPRSTRCRRASTCSGSSPARRGSWTGSRPTSSSPATRRSSGATRSASSPRSRRGTTRSTWRPGSSGRRSRPATRSC